MMDKEMNLIEDLRNPKEKAPSRDGFGKALLELGEKDPNVWALTADVCESTRVHLFAEKFPKRFVQAGIAEQNMASVAAGLATLGKKPFVSAFAAFSPGRNWDQIRVSCCYSNLKVVFHGSHSGLTVGPDGATHQALEDMAIMRALPNMCVMCPADTEEARKAVLASNDWKTPVYIRTEREKVPVFTTEKTPFIIGKANIYRKGKDAAILACGAQVYFALMAAEELSKEGLEVAVADFHTIKPLDTEAVAELAKTKLLVTVEDHQVTGALGSAVAEWLAENGCPARLVRHGMKDAFGESGSGFDLLKKYKLDAEGIKETVKNALQVK